MSNEEATSYACNCGAEHKFPAYVYAHWTEELTHTCDKCGAKYSICRGHAERLTNDKEQS